MQIQQAGRLILITSSLSPTKNDQTLIMLHKKNIKSVVCEYKNSDFELFLDR